MYSTLQSNAFAYESLEAFVFFLQFVDKTTTTSLLFQSLFSFSFFFFLLLTIGCHLSRFWRWLIIPTTCTGWPFCVPSLSLLLSWDQKSHFLDCCLWSLMHQKTGIWTYENSWLTWMMSIVVSHCWSNSPFGRVPNIKFNVAKVLQSLIPIVDQSVSTFSVSPFSFMLHLKVNNFNVGFIFAAFPLVLFSCLALNYCHRRWRKQSVPVWLSSLRIQMLMSVFLPLKPFSRLIMWWCLARLIRVYCLNSPPEGTLALKTF